MIILTIRTLKTRKKAGSGQSFPVSRFSLPVSPAVVILHWGTLICLIEKKLALP
jgi:hypothetical protein